MSARRQNHECLRCGNRWLGRQSFNGSAELPKRCSKCRTPLWNIPRKGVDTLETIQRWQDLGLGVSVYIHARHHREYPGFEAGRVSVGVLTVCNMVQEHIGNGSGATVAEALEEARPRVEEWLGRNENKLAKASHFSDRS